MAEVMCALEVTALRLDATVLWAVLGSQAEPAEMTIFSDPNLSKPFLLDSHMKLRGYGHQPGVRPASCLKWRRESVRLMYK